MARTTLTRRRFSWEARFVEPCNYLQSRVLQLQINIVTALMHNRIFRLGGVTNDTGCQEPEEREGTTIHAPTTLAKRAPFTKHCFISTSHSLLVYVPRN